MYLCCLMATILNLETSTTNCSVSVSRNGKLLALKEHNSEKYSHAEQLHVFIDETLTESGLGKDDLDAVAVSKGPGSYTGLRIGVSAAKGLCFALDVPLISVSTLKSMVIQVDSGAYDFIIPVLDARRMEVYSAVFDDKGNEVRETLAEVVDGNSFERYSEQGTVHIIGSGAEKCKSVLSGGNFHFNTEVVPSAREMCKLAEFKYNQKDFEDVAYFEPYYLKDFVVQGKKKVN